MKSFIAKVSGVDVAVFALVVVVGCGGIGGCLASQHHANVSQGRIYFDNCTCCLAEIEDADQTCYHPFTVYQHRANQS